MSTQREWTTIREYEDILFDYIMGLPASPLTVNAIEMHLLRLQRLK